MGIYTNIKREKQTFPGRCEYKPIIKEKNRLSQEDGNMNE